ncbi:Lactaldehyde reductase [Klebsiella pneumoniae]|uniref:Lactaldehyde reductase n=1 Tax=Klebsiella pneumoniae TaxID=573 RepID=A0A2X3CS25_KLEPN|nr:Lactaldehyde reductase [Klebsiella pneumoniae]
MVVRKEDIPALAQAALADVCTGGNPREASLADIVGYIRRPGDCLARVKQAVPEAVTLHRRTS